MNRKYQMTLRMTLIRRVVLLGAFALGTFAVITSQAGAQTPSPAVVVVITEAGEQGLEIIDPLTAKVVGRIPIRGGPHPHEVAVSPDGKFAFLTSASLGTTTEPEENPDRIHGHYISVIDLVAQKAVRYVETGVDTIPHGVVFAAGKVFFTAEGWQCVGRYDPASDKIDWMYGTGQLGTHMIAVSKDGNKIFTGSAMGGVVVALRAVDHEEAKEDPHASSHPWRETLIPVVHAPEGIAISPDDKEVWVLNKGSNQIERGIKKPSDSIVDQPTTISIIDVATRKVLQTLNPPGAKRLLRIQFTPDGKRAIVIDRNTGAVLVFDAATRKEIKRIKVGPPSPSPLLWGVAIAPDGSRAYLGNRDDNDVAVVDLNKLEVAGHISTGRPEGIAWVERR